MKIVDPTWTRGYDHGRRAHYLTDAAHRPLGNVVYLARAERRTGHHYQLNRPDGPVRYANTLHGAKLELIASLEDPAGTAARDAAGVTDRDAEISGLVERWARRHRRTPTPRQT